MVFGARARAWAILCACWGVAAAAQVNPFEGDSTIRGAGALLFGARCSDCHGADARGARGPNLTLLWGAGASDKRVFDTIRGGVAGSIMPPSFAPDDEIWLIVAYLRSVSTVPAFPAGNGDVERGRKLFVAECLDCHVVRGSGGALGPDLTMIGEVRSREGLVAAIRDPNDAIALGYRAVTLVTQRGDRVRGIAKTEDAFSIQLLARDGRLEGYRKNELREIVREPASAMPRYDAKRLGARKLDDLLAYLGTLRATSTGGAHAK